MRIVVSLVVISLSAPAVAEPALGLAEPEAPPVRQIQEATPGPLYYRVPSDVSTPLLREGFGVALRSPGAAFALDVFPGRVIRFGRGAKLGAWIEGGYSYSRFHDHLVAFGAGPALDRIGPRAGTYDHDGALSFALVPHAVIGSIDGHFGYGVRTSAVASYSLFGLELAHDYLVVGAQRIHEVRVMLTVGATATEGER